MGQTPDDACIVYLKTAHVRKPSMSPFPYWQQCAIHWWYKTLKLCTITITFINISSDPVHKESHHF